jgi:flagella basal body P-ring formation protein FlgA
MKRFIFTSLLLLTTLPVFAEGVIQVGLKASISKPVGALYVRDIVDPDRTDMDFVKTYGAIKVCEEESSCDNIDQTRLFSMLYQAGAPVGRIRFLMTGPVKVEQGQKIEIAAQWLGKIRESLSSYGLSAADIQASQGAVMPNLTAAPADLIVTDVVPQDLTKLSRAVFSVRLKDSEGSENTYTLYTNIHIQAPALMTTVAASESDSFGEDKYISGRQELTTLAQPLLSSSEINGKSLKFSRNIAANTIITRDMVRESEVVKGGSLVMISYVSPSISIKMQGKLVDESEVGSMVQVENMDSKQTLTGKLIAKDRVEVASAR